MRGERGKRVGVSAVVRAGRVLVRAARGSGCGDQLTKLGVAANGGGVVRRRRGGGRRWRGPPAARGERGWGAGSWIRIQRSGAERCGRARMGQMGGETGRSAMKMGRTEGNAAQRRFWI